MEKKRCCKRCGAELPAGSPPAQKYCKRCAVIVQQENAARRKEKFMLAKQAAAINDQQLGKPAILSNSDKSYCRKCVYHGKFSENYLCDYMFIAGERRGCPPGVGCKKRQLEKAEKVAAGLRTCQVCGAQFEGTYKARYCPECRAVKHQEWVNRMAEQRRGRSLVSP